MNYSCLVVKIKLTKKVKKIIEENKITPSKALNYYCISNKVFSDKDIYKFKNDPKEIDTRKLGIKGFSFIEIDFNLSKEFQANNKIDALNYTLFAKSKKSNADKIFVNKPVLNDRRVYAFLLKKEVLKNKRFLKANPKLNPNLPLLYIGETSKTIEDRFLQHTNENNKLAAQIMQRHGVRDFKKANWTPNIYKETNLDPENKNTFNSKYYEREIALKLRDLGYGVWYN
jgi:hypothetical protein